MDKSLPLALAINPDTLERVLNLHVSTLHFIVSFSAKLNPLVAKCKSEGYLNTESLR